jgi:transcriptional regulator with XRE-family HTH domain
VGSAGERGGLLLVKPQAILVSSIVNRFPHLVALERFPTMKDLAQPPHFGVLLKRYRRAAGLTQEALAERAGYSTSYLSKLERGEREPLPFTIVTLAEALGLAPDERAALARAAQPARASSRSRLLPHRASAGTGANPLPLVGRANEVALLEQHLEGAGPPLLLLLGEPGIGKTRLLQEAASQAHLQGWRILEGGCHRHSAQEPYAPLLEALEEYLAHLAPATQREQLHGCDWLIRLLPDLAEGTNLALPAWSVPPAQERRLLFAAVRRFLDQVAGPVGTLLVLDDLQWAGADALDLLASLLRAEGHHPLRLIGSYRSTEVQAADPLSQMVADLAREGRLHRAEVGPLAPSEATALLQLLLQGSQIEGHHPLIKTILQRTGGVPYFLVSCVQGLQSEALDGASNEAIPWAVAETIRQRVGALSEAAQYLLGAVAVAGHEARRSLLLALATQWEWGKREALTALEQACHARLLVEAGADVYRFAHDLIRESVGADLSATRRALLHQQVAEWLEQRGGELPVEALAYHYLQAGLPEQAIRYQEQAGDRAAAMYAHAEAEHAYRQLGDVLNRLGRSAEAAQAQEKLAAVLMAQVHYTEALAALAQARTAYQATQDLAGQARVVAMMGYLHGCLGATEEGIVLLQPWLEPPYVSMLSAQSRGLLSMHFSELLRTSGRFEDALAVAEQAALLARQAQDEALLGQAEWYLGNMLLSLGNLSAAGAAYQAALPLLEQAGDIRGLCIVLGNLMVLGYLSGDLRANESYLARAFPLARQIGDHHALEVMSMHQATNAFLLGAWARARQSFEETIALVRQADMRFGMLTYVLVGLGELLLCQGEEEAGIRCVEEARQMAEQGQDLNSLVAAQMVLAEYTLLRHHPHQAQTSLEPLAHQPGLDERNRLPSWTLLAWAYLEQGCDAEAGELLEQVLATGRTHHLRRVLVEALLVQARLATKQEQWDQAAQALEEAGRLCKEMPWPYAEAKALFVAGQTHARREQWDQARLCLEAALAICQRLGEQLYQEAIQQALDQLPLQGEPSSTPGDGEAL